MNPEEKDQIVEAEVKPRAIFAAMLKVMRGITPLPKDGVNAFHKYHFRSLDDLLNLVHPLLADAGIIILPTVIDRKEVVLDKGLRVTLRVQYQFVAGDGSFLTTMIEGEAADTSDKSTQKALSAAFKYVLFQVFSIAVADPSLDGDRESPDVTAKPQPVVKPQAAGKPVEKSGVISSETKETLNDNPGGSKRATFIPTVQTKSGEKNGKPWTRYTITSPSGNSITTFSATNGQWAQAAEKEGKVLGFIFKETTFKDKKQNELLDCFDPAMGGVPA